MRHQHQSLAMAPAEALHVCANRARRGLLSRILVTGLVLLWASAAFAQDRNRDDASGPPLLWEVAKRVALDPTTYAPTGIVYTSRRLDWASSQPLFRIGWVEANPNYTQSGLPVDLPVSNAAGKREIMRQTATVFERSLANNALSAVFEHVLIARAPNHRKLIRTLGWIERIAFSSYWSAKISTKHFRQWQENERLARELGAP